MKSGAAMLVEALRAEGVSLVFGYQGAAVIPVFDALMDCPDIRTVVTRHEQAAAHAADGYARVSGRVGVCVSTSGPGATNLVTGIACAYMDSTPLVALCGQVRRGLIGNDAFQEVDVVGITRPVSKHNYLVDDPDDLPRVLREAFYVARSGRPGPVVVDLPVDVLRSDIGQPLPDRIHMDSYRPRKVASSHPGQIKRAADAINASGRPLFLAGGGVISSVGRDRGRRDADAPGLLLAAAEAAGIPVATTLMGLGGFPSGHPLCLHMPGMHGAACANRAIQECDCLVALGTRFVDRVTGRVDRFAPKARIVHIDIDPTSVGKNVRVDVPVISDAGDALAMLGPRLRGPDSPARQAWLGQVAAWKAELWPSFDPAGGGLKPQAVIQAVTAALDAKGGDRVIATEVGQHQMWAALFGRFDRPRRWVSSGGLGAMGFGLPAAMGAQLALPQATVVDIAGDGSIQMNLQEFATLAARGIPVKVVVLDNQCLGMVRQWQQLFWSRRYAGTDFSDNPDFVKVARAFGLSAWRVDRPDRLGPVLSEALACPGPALVDVMVEREENVYPMVPAGESLDAMLLGPS